MHWLLLAVLVVLPDAVQAACGCVNNVIQSDGTGACLEETHTRAWGLSGWENRTQTIRFRFSGTPTQQCWQFADGSWGVEDGVQLTAIEPNATGCGDTSGSCRNGWTVNPTSRSGNYFDHSVDGTYSASRVAEIHSLPYTPAVNDVIIKADSLPNPPLDTQGNRLHVGLYATLTVLDVMPSGSGTGAAPGDVFRPPIFGTTYKPTRNIASVDLDVLPDLATVPDAISKAEALEITDATKVTYGTSVGSGFLFSAAGGPGYAPARSSEQAKAAFWLALDHPDADKLEVARGLIQEGIDIHAVLRDGGNWEPNAGIGNARFQQVVLTAALLNDADMAADLAANENDRLTFTEWGHMQTGRDGTILYGRPRYSFFCRDENYWACLDSSIGGTGCGKDCYDPHGYIDGGDNPPGGSYQEVNFGPYSYVALLWKLVPATRTHFRNAEIVPYAERIRTVGSLLGPAADLCRAPNGGAANYEVTWGPDPSSPDGDCIKGSPTRFASSSGFGGGTFTRPFGEDMWNAYASCGDDCSCGGMTGLCDDADGDGLFDYQDNCPFTSNPDQADDGGVATVADPSGAIKDGIGDACQCGDVDNDGRATGGDGSLIKQACLNTGPYAPPNSTASCTQDAPGPPEVFVVDKCDVQSPANGCSGLDGTVVQRAAVDLPPGVAQSCPAAN